MTPDDVLKQFHVPDSTLNLPRDPVGGLVIAMGIMSPTNKQRSRSNFPHATNDHIDRPLRLFAFIGNEPIAETEEKYLLGPQAQLGARLSCFQLAETRQSLRRVGLAVWMRSSAIANNDDLSVSIRAGKHQQSNLRMRGSHRRDAAR
jgi:hypothetical protein